MKKLILMFCLSLTVVFFVATPAWADFITVFSPKIEFASPIDSIIAYGEGDPSLASEQDYFAQALGYANYAALVAAGYTYFKDPSTMGQETLNLFNPGFAWDYALIKVDGPNDFWYMFVDDKTAPNGDNLLTTPAVGTLIATGVYPNPLLFNYSMKDNGKMGSYGISHASYLTSESTPPNVPEPSTLLLLGTGVLGLGIFGKRKFGR
jgi:hypothetical protein